MPHRQHLWLSSAMEGLFTRGLARERAPELNAALAQVGVDVAQPGPLARGVLTAALEVVGPALWPSLTAEQRQWELGTRLTRGYFDTLLGRAMVAGLSLAGPSLGIVALPRNLRSVTNYLQARVDERHPKYALATVQPVDDLAWFVAGMCHESGVLFSGGPGRTAVHLVSRDAERAVLRFEWQ